MTFEYDPEMMTRLVPAHLREGLRLHVEKGVPTGEGLYSILSDAPASRVIEVCDESTLAGLRSLIIYLVNYVPGPAWGSPEKVLAWRKAGGIEGQCGGVAV